MARFVFAFLILCLAAASIACGGSSPPPAEPTAVPAATTASVSPTDAPAADTSAPAMSGETELVSEGYEFTFQYVCVNRTLRPCQLVDEFIKGVNERTEGQITINLSSYPELARIHRSETSVSLTQGMMGKGRRTGLARFQ